MTKYLTLTWLNLLCSCVTTRSPRGWVCLRGPRFSSGWHGQELQCWVPLLHVFNSAKQVNMTRWVLLYHILYIVWLQCLLELPSSYKVLHLQYYIEWEERNKTSNWILIIWFHLSENRLASFIINYTICITITAQSFIVNEKQEAKSMGDTWIPKWRFHYRSEIEQKLEDKIGWPFNSAYSMEIT